MFLWAFSTPSTVCGVSTLHDYDGITSNCGLDNTSWRKSKVKWGRWTQVNWLTPYFGIQVQRNVNQSYQLYYISSDTSSIRTSLHVLHSALVLCLGRVELLMEMWHCEAECLWGSGLWNNKPSLTNTPGDFKHSIPHRTPLFLIPDTAVYLKGKLCGAHAGLCHLSVQCIV